ncbi:hypothetical protein Pmani_026870 [Petrolisthes manimaculis]|uniref:Uncharacterized protein n=1 Tax=Petrolisthes manimaculis TaxID=1843537 RepID=A0AAE1TZP2_9EUCA|nr:hypothetical protein Pmani_026870 [Petrolisthes manimaculis]
MWILHSIHPPTFTIHSRYCQHSAPPHPLAKTGSRPLLPPAAATCNTNYGTTPSLPPSLPTLQPLLNHILHSLHPHSVQLLPNPILHSLHPHYA